METVKLSEDGGIKLPDIPVGGRAPQLPVNVYPITSQDVVEVIARGITAYMNERLTKIYAIAYTENIALKNEIESLRKEKDIADKKVICLNKSIAELEKMKLRAAMRTIDRLDGDFTRFWKTLIRKEVKTMPRGDKTGPPAKSAGPKNGRGGGKGNNSGKGTGKQTGGKRNA